MSSSSAVEILFEVLPGDRIGNALHRCARTELTCGNMRKQLAERPDLRHGSRLETVVRFGHLLSFGNEIGPDALLAAFQPDPSGHVGKRRITAKERHDLT
jgi:hypothetical protein